MFKIGGDKASNTLLNEMMLNESKNIVQVAKL